ncbi:hypothetical protein Poli38472_008902 [Pythium oligandrum]|uniref:Cilia- and flagella-associated protein 58 central coiled coil domain-containing protein n=1 Tax=Pythium oligandrum TaxID=41045 RepID=A0A8K1C4E7_PYTOL|nr:hypothetical protein Poli38472_008902 [Pythium oligandrum]|eukprot:TMW56254.1 hypothetical protein Poli38472_008902 [Pythium oligandrum]
MWVASTCVTDPNNALNARPSWRFVKIDLHAVIYVTMDDHEHAVAAADDAGVPADVLLADSSSFANAFRLLEQYFEADMLTLEQMQFHKDKYTKLNTFVLDTYKHEKMLLKQAKALNTELLTDKIQVEKQSIRKAEELAALSSVEKEKEKALKELAECIDRDALLTFEITELQREHVDLLGEREDILAAHAKLVEPEVRKLTEEISSLSEENHRMDSEIAKEQQRKRELLARLETLKTENAKLETSAVSEQKQLHQVQNDPERLERQADVVQKAVANLEREIAKARERGNDLDGTVVTQTIKLKEAEDVQKELMQKLELHRETIEQRQRDVDHVTLHFREEQNTHVVRLSEKTRLEMAQHSLDMSLRRETERVAKDQKEYDRLKRELKKKILLYDNSKGLLPNLKAQVLDAQHQLTALRTSNKKQESEQHDVKQQIDVLIARFLKHEDSEKEQNEELETMAQNVTSLEEEVAQWIQEEAKHKKLVAMLTAQRELKAREAASALEAEKQTQQELKMKELVIFDLAKKWNETNNHLKEFSALYDVVKNERNKYVNLIQAASQALAEMKEKIKILQNEVEVLRNESIAKDKALGKERLAHTTAQCSRDSLRLETNKCHDQYRLKQEQVEQQIVSIDKLNAIITMTERELLRLKKKYEAAVDARNATGVQLIDRNDELCILYEKSNHQEKALNEGEIGLTRKEQEIRMLRIQLADLQRQVENARKQLPYLPQFAQRILDLQEELKQEKEVTELLCRDLETPKNNERWRALDGDDPDEEQLQAKIAFLEGRYHRKKEQLLEKELVLEEVTSLSNKLRTQATERRGETLALAKKVNDFQTKIKETTRKMMAIVSELSMYQATAMKLQQEKHDSMADFEETQRRFDAGHVPNAFCEQQLLRFQLQRQRDEELRLSKQQMRATAQHAQSFPTQLTYTSAEPRPNAYIPEDLGIPKPYGVQAPFKPTQTGSTMRHIRMPQKRDIEI